MINDKIRKQQGGENSTNLQSHSIVINQGISYQDAKEIAIDIFKSNYLELSEKAASKARQRAEELIDEFLIKLQERNPSAISSMEEPGMQSAIFTAQKEYAKTGDRDLSDMLVDILVDRAGQQERNLTQIVLDESLLTVPKLTTNQLDTLTIIFLFAYSVTSGINTIPRLKNYLQIHVSPFVESLSKENSLYQHLEFTGCGSTNSGLHLIENIFLQNYMGLFCKGFTREEFEESGNLIEKYPMLIIPCLQDPAKFQISVINDETFDFNANSAGMSQFEINTLKSFMHKYQMNGNEAKEILKKQGDYMEKLFDVWDNSSLKHITLTSVGIAIATANLRRKTGMSVDLNKWIK